MRSFQKEDVGKAQTYILCPITFFFRKSCQLWDNVEKFCRAGQNTHDNMAYAHSVLDDYGYKYTLRIFSSYCFSRATMVTRQCLGVALYAPYQSLFLVIPCHRLYRCNDRFIR